jgi:hypothetical protein
LEPNLFQLGTATDLDGTVIGYDRGMCRRYGKEEVQPTRIVVDAIWPILAVEQREVLHVRQTTDLLSNFALLVHHHERILGCDADLLNRRRLLWRHLAHGVLE